MIPDENTSKIYEISKNIKSTHQNVFLNCLNFLIPARQLKWSRFAGGPLDQENPPQKPGMGLLTVAVLLTRNSLTRPHMAHIAHTRTPLSSPSLDKCTRTSTVSFCNKTQDSGTVPWPNTPFCVPVVYTSRDLTWLTWQRKCQNRVSLSRIANLLLTPLTPFVSRAQFRPGSNLFSDPHSAPSE